MSPYASNWPCSNATFDGQKLNSRDRLFWVGLRMIWQNWKSALVMVLCFAKTHPIACRFRICSGSSRAMRLGNCGNLGNIGNVESATWRPQYPVDETNPPSSAPRISRLPSHDGTANRQVLRASSEQRERARHKLPARQIPEFHPTRQVPTTCALCWSSVRI